MTMPEQNLTPLLPGESAVDGAPRLELAQGSYCVPQHYLSYQHTQESVEQLVLKIHYSDKYPVFVSQDDSGLYLQVGIIGYDNYRAKSAQAQAKIVYGRKWRVEPQLPSSEIIQTVFLAIKTAREHEIRELFRWSIDERSTTPFNNHHDLPLLARKQKMSAIEHKHQSRLTTEHLAAVLRQTLAHIRYDAACFELASLERRPSGQYLLELHVLPSADTQLEELKTQRYISFVIDEASLNHCLHGLMQTLIQWSNRHVDEHFIFDGVARFSWHHNLADIARLSYQTRQLHLDVDKLDFSKRWQQANYETDLTRVPKLNASELTDRLMQILHIHSPLDGVLPQF